MSAGAEVFRWRSRTCLLLGRCDGSPAVDLDALNTWFCLPGGALQHFPGHGEATRVLDIILNAMRQSQLSFVICRCKQELLSVPTPGRVGHWSGIILIDHEELTLVPVVFDKEVPVEAVLTFSNLCPGSGESK